MEHLTIVIICLYGYLKMSEELRNKGSVEGASEKTSQESETSLERYADLLSFIEKAEQAVSDITYKK